MPEVTVEIQEQNWAGALGNTEIDETLSFEVEDDSPVVTKSFRGKSLGLGMVIVSIWALAWNPQSGTGEELGAGADANYAH